MYIPVFYAPSVYTPSFLLFIRIVSLPLSLSRPTVYQFLYSPSLILGLGSFLMLALVLVVFLVDLQRGGFTV